MKTVEYIAREAGTSYQLPPAPRYAETDIRAGKPIRQPLGNCSTADDEVRGALDRLSAAVERALLRLEAVERRA